MRLCLYGVHGPLREAFTSAGQLMSAVGPRRTQLVVRPRAARMRRIRIAGTIMAGKYYCNVRSPQETGQATCQYCHPPPPRLFPRCSCRAPRTMMPTARAGVLRSVPDPLLYLSSPLCVSESRGSSSHARAALGARLGLSAGEPGPYRSDAAFERLSAIVVAFPVAHWSCVLFSGVRRLAGSRQAAGDGCVRVRLWLVVRAHHTFRSRLSRRCACPRTAASLRCSVCNTSRFRDGRCCRTWRPRA
ncbi:hypothetical protein C2E23DRAFT_844904 [Lenzites betulinus]|nr:hypothetical protein C2E23DRAFT_844904 [Lenzites betulinus]